MRWHLDAVDEPCNLAKRRDDDLLAVWMWERDATFMQLFFLRLRRSVAKQLSCRNSSLLLDGDIGIHTCQSTETRDQPPFMFISPQQILELLSLVGRKKNGKGVGGWRRDKSIWASRRLRRGGVFCKHQHCYYTHHNLQTTIHLTIILRRINPRTIIWYTTTTFTQGFGIFFYL